MQRSTATAHVPCYGASVDDKTARTKLQRAMARMVAHRKQLQETREKLQQHASDRLDGVQASVEAAAEGMRVNPNILTHRYGSTKIREAARLRAVALRAEAARDDRSE